MRLTLRTLLSYLDDTLEPAQARVIGQKLAESETAQELVERIKQVTRRRRLTTPPPTGPSGMDPNTIAEYIDNAVTPEQASEVEEICLQSDVHLAEVAACHQILTLILGEPASVPLEANQRMVNLVKGPEAIPFRRPASQPRVDADAYAEPREVDETLRLGLPPIGPQGSWKNRLILAGGGLLAACLLVFAVIQILPGDKEKPHGKDQYVKGPDADKIHVDKDTPPKDTPPKDEVKNPDKKDNGDKKDGVKDTPTKDGTKDAPTKDKDGSPKDKINEPVNPGEIPFALASEQQIPVGHMMPLGEKKSILLQMTPDKKDWKRVLPKENESEVSSARPLLALPAIRGEIQLNKGLKLMLWGNMPEQQLLNVPLYESKVELFAHDKLDLDMMIYRGRIVLTSTRETPVRVRVRFENPQARKRTKKEPGKDDKKDGDLYMQDFADVTLQDKGASILIDRLAGFHFTGEPFFKDPDSVNRVGPPAMMVFNVLAGTVFLKVGDVTHTMNAPPGPFRFIWNSLKGPSGAPMATPEIPPELTFEPPLRPNDDPKARKELSRVRETLIAQLALKPVDVVFAETIKSNEPAARRLAIRCYAATDDLTSLVEAVENASPTMDSLRRDARDALRDWIGASRDNDYRLLDVLKAKYKKREAESIMEMLHGFTIQETRRPELYQTLIDYLTSPNQVIRELASWHLNGLVPGQHIPYSAAADAETRNAAAAAWRALIPPGQMPPPPKK